VGARGGRGERVGREEQRDEWSDKPEAARAGRGGERGERGSGREGERESGREGRRRVGEEVSSIPRPKLGCTRGGLPAKGTAALPYPTSGLILVLALALAQGLPQAWALVLQPPLSSLA